MSSSAGLIGFPEIVNEKAARTVAGGVVLLSLATIVFQEKWLLIPLAYGFWARVLTGPKLSPLGQLATRVIAPKLGTPKLVAGPPKRFAQGVGVVFSTSSLIIWFATGNAVVASVILGSLTAAAVLESVFAVCLGCKGFAVLMKTGIIPESVCEACLDISRLHSPAT